MLKFFEFEVLLFDCFVYGQNVICLNRFTRYGHYAGKKVKVKERIVLSEIHLRTTGHHLSMGSHSAICHPTEVSVSECSFLTAHQHKKAI